MGAGRVVCHSHCGLDCSQGAQALWKNERLNVPLYWFPQPVGPISRPGQDLSVYISTFLTVTVFFVPLLVPLSVPLGPVSTILLSPSSGKSVRNRRIPISMECMVFGKKSAISVFFSSKQWFLATKRMITAVFIVIIQCVEKEVTLLFALMDRIRTKMRSNGAYCTLYRQRKMFLPCLAR